ncbi:MAG: sigma 54-interacting transcriptional regulator [Deltaproteobacteria bacterium]|nr:sigma 54-interacting transcriptional regulator [Deltaproteobacteria bacterium]
MHLRVLFLCGENSCRSQMAEGLLRSVAPEAATAASAGMTAARVHPRAVEVMDELGIDISSHESKPVSQLAARAFDVVITLCDPARQYCLLPSALSQDSPTADDDPQTHNPVIAGVPVLLHWSVADPAEATGSDEEVVQAFRQARDEIRRRLADFVESGTLAALTESRRRFETVLDSLDEGIIIHDEERRIYVFNEAAERITGHQRDDVIGRDCHAVFSPCGLCSAQCQFQDGPPAHLRDQQEVRLTTKAGEDRRLKVRVRALDASMGRPGQVLARFRDVTELKSLRRELRERHSFHNMVAVSRSMRETFDTITQVASSDYPILITGESGAGKELVARAIHDESPRKGGPFVPLNCGALPDHILESELFGHVRGAFTGAVQSRRGRFELADGGTLLLDEVGELSPVFQVKLLRVLQEKSFERVGGERPITVDVRILAATHRDLREMVRQGTFREDLFYRLSVVPITVPSLRHRREDIPVLTEHILAKIALETKAPAAALSDETVDLLTAHPWPGNVRELINALRFASVRSKGEPIMPQHLPVEVQQTGWDAPPPSVRSGPPPASAPPPPAPAAGRRRDKLTTESVLAALAETGGNKVRAAKLLGVGRATLYRFLDRNPLP